MHVLDIRGQRLAGCSTRRHQGKVVVILYNSFIVLTQLIDERVVGLLVGCAACSAHCCGIRIVLFNVGFGVNVAVIRRVVIRERQELLTQICGL